MGIRIPNTFTSYELTDKEQLDGAILTTLQKQYIQNQRASLAEEKLMIEFDPEHPNDFIQQEAYKRGQIEILSYLLDSSDAAEYALVNNTVPNSLDSSEE